MGDLPGILTREPRPSFQFIPFTFAGGLSALYLGRSTWARFDQRVRIPRTHRTGWRPDPQSIVVDETQRMFPSTSS